MKLRAGSVRDSWFFAPLGLVGFRLLPAAYEVSTDAVEQDYDSAAAKRRKNAALD